MREEFTPIPRGEDPHVPPGAASDGFDGLPPLGDPGLRARIGSKARERVMTHSLDGIAAAYSAAIEDVLEARGHLGAVEGSRAAPARVRRARFELHDVLALELELARVFDDDHALVFGNQRGQGIQERCLAGARATGDDHVLLAFDERAQRFERVRRERVELEQAGDGQRFFREPADGDGGSVR